MELHPRGSCPRQLPPSAAILQAQAVHIGFDSLRHWPSDFHPGGSQSIWIESCAVVLGCQRIRQRTVIVRPLVRTLVPGILEPYPERCFRVGLR